MPELELLRLRENLERDAVPYCLATVISVRGSASAKPGSKMLVSAKGENLWGWVGGGCAESYTCENALEALKEARTRIITADLDDEIFGLGMPCGGQMDIFLEPVLPPQELRFPGGPTKALRTLAEHYGFLARFAQAREESISPTECVRALATAIAEARSLKPRPLGGEHVPLPAQPSEFLIVGHSRITEELAKLGALLGWRTRVYGLGLEARAYPSSVAAAPAQPDYAGLEIQPESFVVVASHHKGDHHYIASALAAGAAYVGMVSSKKRAGLVFEHLRAQGLASEQLAKVHTPAGLELGCRNPGEIALSIAAELLGPAS